ncbi:hypothetical protein E4P42_16025 [Mycobacterium sp. PS03-16]|nr:hypothetical protein E4P42_16025 [Mycobacterium sp. PS03-16]
MPTGADADKDLGLVLSYLTGRKLTLDEVLAAVEMSRSTYYDRQARGALTTTDTLLTAARNLGLNPVDLLVRYGRIEVSEVADYVEEERHPLGRSMAGPSTLTGLPEQTARRARRTVTPPRPRPDSPPL